MMASGSFLKKTLLKLKPQILRKAISKQWHRVVFQTEKIKTTRGHLHHFFPIRAARTQIELHFYEQR